jgi:hypothetical protein
MTFYGFSKFFSSGMHWQVNFPLWEVSLLVQNVSFTCKFSLTKFPLTIKFSLTKFSLTNFVAGVHGELLNMYLTRQDRLLFAKTIEHLHGDSMHARTNLPCPKADMNSLGTRLLIGKENCQFWIVIPGTFQRFNLSKIHEVLEKY